MCRACLAKRGSQEPRKVRLRLIKRRYQSRLGVTSHKLICLRRAVIERDGLICGICRYPVARKDVHIDHRIPVSRGGATTLENLQVTHARCNVVKGARLIAKLGESDLAIDEVAGFEIQCGPPQAVRAYGKHVGGVV